MIALASLAVVAVTVLSCATLLGRQARQHARERMLLVNQLLHATGRPWQEAPAASRREDLDSTFDGPEPLPFLPDQLP